MPRVKSSPYFIVFSGLLMLASSPVWARYDAKLIKEYTGNHQEEFTSQFDRVRILAKQAQIEVSSRLGLVQYREGFQYPLTIRFEDGAPAGIENALAYVQLMHTREGFAQQMVVNLDAMAAYPTEFDQVFYHEMTHAVMNDAVGGEASSKIPHWTQEGLAMYVAEQGKERVKESARSYRKSQVQALILPLDGRYSGDAYAQYYLAIEYLYEKHSVNAVQALVRNLIQGKTVIDSVEDATGLTWAKFQEEVKTYSLKVLQEYARPDY